MVDRTVDDRRVTNKSVKEDLRKLSRRTEDVANIKSYYYVMSLSCGTLALIGIMSFIWGR